MFLRLFALIPALIAYQKVKLEKTQVKVDKSLNAVSETKSKMIQNAVSATEMLLCYNESNTFCSEIIRKVIFSRVHCENACHYCNDITGHQQLTEENNNQRPMGHNAHLSEQL